jgi:hypothetical protein
VALVILDPNIDRFGLRDYFSGAFLHSMYKGPQLSSMVEEVLYLLITIFSEYANPLEAIYHRLCISLLTAAHFHHCHTLMTKEKLIFP